MTQEDQGAAQELKQVEVSIELAKKKVSLGKALDVLLNNKYFKELIMEEYLKNYAVHVVKNKSSYGMQEEAQQKYLDNEIIAIGSFDQFLRFISMEAAQAEQTIRDDEETREEILEEAL